MNKYYFRITSLFLLVIFSGLILSCDILPISLVRAQLNSDDFYYTATPLTAVAGLSNTGGISPTWNKLISAEGIVYSIAAADGNNSPPQDGVTSGAVKVDSASGKVTITDKAVAENSGTYTVTATMVEKYQIYEKDSNAKTDISIEVNPLLEDTPIIATIGVQSTVKISVPADSVVSISITPKGSGTEEVGSVSVSENEISINTEKIGKTDYVLTVEGKGNYEGTATQDITVISKWVLNAADIAADGSDYIPTATIVSNLPTSSATTPLLWESLREPIIPDNDSSNPLNFDGKPFLVYIYKNNSKSDSVTATQTTVTIGQSDVTGAIAWIFLINPDYILGTPEVKVAVKDFFGELKTNGMGIITTNGRTSIHKTLLDWRDTELPTAPTDVETSPFSIEEGQSLGLIFVSSNEGVTKFSSFEIIPEE